MKESMLMVEGKRDGGEYGLNYRMRAVSFSGSSPFHNFFPNGFHEPGDTALNASLYKAQINLNFFLYIH